MTYPSCCTDSIPDTLPDNPQKPIVYVSAALIIRGEEEILIQQRPEGTIWAGMWELPGGKMETGETAESCLCRELHEEIDIMTSPTCLLPFSFATYDYTSEGGKYAIINVFALRQWQGTPKEMEGQTLKWVKPVDLYDYPLIAADIPLIPKIIEYLK